MADVLESLVVKLAMDAADYDSTISKAQGGLDSFAGNAAKAGTVMSAAVTAPIVAIGVSALGMASDLNETVSKVDTLFGDTSASIQAWAENSETSFGLSEQAALDAVGGLGNMFMQLGAQSGEAAALGQEMVGLSADIASFHNVAGGSEQVLGAMTSAFRGEYDALQAFIPTINAAAVEHAALAATGKEAATELTALEKATAVQTLIMQGAGAAVGDFARTSDGLANTQRILSAEMASLGAEMGQELLPIALEVMGWARDLLGWFTQLSPETKQWILIIGGAAAAIGPVLVVLAGMASAISTIIGVATAAGPVIAALGGAITLLTGPIGLVVLAVAALAAAWATDFGGIRTKTEEFWGWLTGEWPGWMGELQSGWEEFSGWWQSNTQSTLATAQDDWQRFSTNVIEINSSFWQNVGELAGTGMEAAQGTIKGGTQIMQGDWSGGLETLRTTAETFWTSINEQFGAQIEAIKGIITAVDWGGFGGDIVGGIADGITDNLTWIKDAAEGAAKAAMESAKSWLGIGSPSKVAAAQLGVPFTQGVALGAERAVPQAATTIQDALNALVGSLEAPRIGAALNGSAANTINITIYASDQNTANQARTGLIDALRQAGLG